MPLIFYSTLPTVNIDSVRFSFVTNVAGGDAAEFWVLFPGINGSKAPGRFGRAKEHVILYYNDAVGTHNGRDRAMTITHEFGHHGYDLVDEYSGPTSCVSGNPTGHTTSNVECVTNSSATACIMDNYWVRGPAGGPTEFCTSANHDPDADTYQECIHGTDCWTHAASQWSSLSAPSGAPQDAAPASQPITWTILEPEKRFVSVLDRSGSMSGLRMLLAKSAANLLVGLSETGDKIGVVSFASSASVNYPLTEITGNAQKAAARNAINALYASGSTAMGRGLQTALGQFTAQSRRACQQNVILLSDGYHNTGIHPSSVVPSLKQNGVIVHTIGVGLSVDNALLSSIASGTGGVFRHVASPFGLLSAYLSLWVETTDDAGILNLAPGTITPSTPSQTIPIAIEPGLGRGIFGLTWEGSGNVLTLAVLAPDGRRIDPTNAASYPDVEFITETNANLFLVQNPIPGDWVMEITWVSGANQISYTAQALSEGGQAALDVFTDRETYEYPEQVLIQAQVYYDDLVSGAEVTADVVRPGGSIVTLSLFDDGEQAHGDLYPQDGIYSNYFSAYNDDGVYSIDVTASNSNGTIVPGEDFFPGEFSAPSVPPFTRVASKSVIVNGVPDFVSTAFDFDPNTLNRKSHGKYITAYIEPPQGMSVEDILVSSLRFEDAIDPDHSKSEIVDYDEDGVFELMTKFDRAAVIELLSPGLGIPLSISGEIDGQYLIATGSVNVIEPGNSPSVTASIDSVSGVKRMEVKWNPSSNDLNVTSDLLYSESNGKSWKILAEDVPAKGYWMGQYPDSPAASIIVGIEDETIECVEQALISDHVVTPTTVLKEAGSLPDKFEITSVTPNPFNPETQIGFALDRPAEVHFEILNVLGQVVFAAPARYYDAGVHQVTWNARDNFGSRASSGIYFVKLTAYGQSRIAKMLLMK